MTVYFMDSFSDRSNFPQLGWKYEQSNVGQGIVTGYSPRSKAPAGQGWFLDDGGSYSVEFAKTIGTMGTWAVGIRITPVLDGATSCMFLRLTYAQTDSSDQSGDNAATICAVGYANDGTLSFYRAGAGTMHSVGVLLGSATNKLISGQQTYIEILFVGGLTGSLTVMQDDVQIAHFANVNFGLINPDRAAFRKDHAFYGTAGLTIQDFYIADSLLGPVKITAFPVASDSIPQGFTRGGVVVNDANYQQVDEFQYAIGATDKPDGDHTYVYNKASAAVTDLYRPAVVACYGKILAVALNVTCRSISGSPNIQPLVRQGATRYNLGSAQAVPAGSYLSARGSQVTPGTGDALYDQLQLVAQNQPTDSTDWDDASIRNADWGMLSDTGGVFRVTAVTLEKLVSLRSVPYRCPGGSYSF